MIEYDRIEQIDELTRGEHYYLGAEDECYFLGEYTAAKGFSHSKTNSAILNLKIAPTKPQNRLYYKSRAIIAFARELRKLTGQRVFEEHAFVPVPPSKTPGHPDFDNRLMQVLARAAQGWNADIRPLVVQNGDRDAAHASADMKRSPDNFDYRINEDCAIPAPRSIFIFDDVLNTGASYVAMKRLLRARFPDAEIRGLFLARCIHLADLSFFED